MTRTPRVTVLIPTFNRGHFLAQCLDSIQSQTLSPSQIIVVNNGSTDHTVEMLKPYGDGIESIVAPQLGKPAALNAGLERVTGDYLWIFDDDDVAFPEALARLVTPLEQHPEHGFSYGTYYCTANRPEDNRLGSILCESSIPDVQERGFLLPLLEANFLGGAALFARTSCYAGVGGFDTRLVRSQDYDMAIRIARRFTGIRIPGSATFHYRQHAGLRGRAHDQFQAGTRFRKWLEYDQMIFRDLYQQMTLAEYLPPGTSPKEGLRQAYLQRLAILASKLLMPEIHTELDIIATLPDQTPLSTPERQIVRSLVFNHPFYRQGSVVERFAFHDHIRRLAKTSTVIRMIRQELSASLSSHWKETGRWKSPRRTAGTAYKICRLYMSGFWQRRPAITQTGL